METEISNIASRHASGRAWWDTLGGLAPGFGMLGTLIGLVAMLKNLGSGSTVVLVLLFTATMPGSGGAILAGWRLISPVSVSDLCRVSGMSGVG